jgi:hypothetical protein
MNNGGHPHREGLSLGLISSGRSDQGRRHYQVGKRRHEPGNEKNDGGRQDDCEHQGKDIEAVGRAGHPRLTPFDRSQSQMQRQPVARFEKRANSARRRKGIRKWIFLTALSLALSTR